MWKTVYKLFFTKLFVSIGVCNNFKGVMLGGSGLIIKRKPAITFHSTPPKLQAGSVVSVKLP